MNESGDSASAPSSSRSIADLPAPVIVIRGVPKQKRSLRPWLLGASLASVLALSVIALRSRQRARARSSAKSVAGTLAKSVLWAAAGSIPKLVLLRLAREMLPRDSEDTVAADHGRGTDEASLPTDLPETPPISPSR